MTTKMADYRNSGGQRDMVCIDTNRVLDSCRDKDCFEDVRVYLTDCGQQIVDRASVVRAKCAKVEWACIDIDSVPFNRGFYQLLIRIYTKVTCEACIGPGNTQEFDGVAVVEKKVILFGGEGNVSVFKSELAGAGFCACGTGNTTSSNSLPVAVLEIVDPIIIDTKVVEPHKPCQCFCCCAVDEIPERVASLFQNPLTEPNNANILLVSLGFFSVVRIERPAQYLVNAVEYSVPEKECAAPAMEDPCSLFRQMAFPVSEFCPSPTPPQVQGSQESLCPGRCGCQQ